MIGHGLTLKDWEHKNCFFAIKECLIRIMKDCLTSHLRSRNTDIIYFTSPDCSHTWLSLHGWNRKGPFLEKPGTEKQFLKPWSACSETLLFQEVSDLRKHKITRYKEIFVTRKSRNGLALQDPLNRLPFYRSQFSARFRPRRSGKTTTFKSRKQNQHLREFLIHVLSVLWNSNFDLHASVYMNI